MSKNEKVDHKYTNTMKRCIELFDPKELLQNLPDILAFIMKEAAKIGSMSGKKKKEWTLAMMTDLVNYMVEQKEVGSEALMVLKLAPVMIDKFCMLEKGDLVINSVKKGCGCLF